MRQQQKAADRSGYALATAKFQPNRKNVTHDCKQRSYHGEEVNLVGYSFSDLSCSDDLLGTRDGCRVKARTCDKHCQSYCRSSLQRIQYQGNRTQLRRRTCHIGSADVAAGGTSYVLANKLADQQIAEGN